MKRKLDYEHEFDDSGQRYIGMDPKPLPPMPDKVKFALICDTAHGRRTDSALPLFEQCYLGANWKGDIKIAHKNGYLKIANQFEKLPFCTNDVLKDVCRQNNLKVGGNKHELVDRITNNLSEQKIAESIPYDFWIRTEKGDEIFEMYSPHVRNYEQGSYYDFELVSFYTEKVKKQYGHVDVNRVFYELNKHDLKRLMDELSIDFSKGSWGSVMMRYKALYYWADFFGDYEHALYYKTVELTIQLSGLINGGIIKGFQYVNAPSYKNDFSKTLINYGEPIEHVTTIVFSALEQIYKQLPFHYFTLDALKDIFYQTLRGSTVELKTYNPLLQFSSENYKVWFNVELDKKTNKIIVVKNS